jgi:eukaryotic-like serine/threonine-protein kinase
VSPQNLLVSTTGAVKVIDFGIAKAHNRKQGETRTGVVKGKIQYMAPEQVKKGRTVDRRTDIWALGVCLHELMTGKLPYDGDDDIEVINKLLSDEAPKPAEGLPEPIARILERSIVLDPDARFPTAAGMQRAIESAMKELGESTTSDDIASFLRSELPELSQKRRDVVNKGVEEARERGGTSSAEKLKVAEPDVAFAPTLMSDRRPQVGMDRPSDAGTVALVKRKEPARTSTPLAQAAFGDVDQEPIEIPKTSKAWLWILLILVVGGAGAAYRWPEQAKSVLAKLGIGGSSEPALQAVPVPTDTTAAAATATAPVESATPTATTSASAVSAPSELPSAAASASAVAPARPEPASTHHTWPTVHEPANPSATAAPPATVPWSPYKNPPPPANTGDNPYQGSSP